MAPPSVTVVIPALNEAARLPGLLSSLNLQTAPPEAIVVADAGSTDTTRDVAAAAGATVVDGGMPGVGRNAGAAAATTDLILFLDADNELDGDWIEQAVVEFECRGLGVAAGQIEPIERDAGNLIACEAVNLFLQLVQYVVPHAPGCCILVRRDIHERIGGFDETIVLAEDHEYVQRAAKLGTFRILRCDPMRTSMRRVEREGLVGLAFMYLYSESHVMTGRPMRELPFEYEFAAFDREGHRPVRVGREAVREWLSSMGEPLKLLSADTIEFMRLLGDTEVSSDSIERLLAEMAPGSVGELRQYLGGRLELAKRMRPVVLRRMRRRGERIWRDLAEEFRDR